jgi:hypothetical protein
LFELPPERLGLLPEIGLYTVCQQQAIKESLVLPELESVDLMESELAPELAAQLRAHGLTAEDEVSLRRTLEEGAQSWTLIRLNTIAAKRWKARYRLMLGERWYDAATASNAYALGILALLQDDPASSGE